MKYSTVLFDLDGTLTDPVQGICGSVRYALQKAGRPVGPIESYHKYIGPPLLRSFEVYANATPEEAQELLGYYRERFSTVGLFENEVYPGIPELLRDLKASDVRIAVATGKPTVFSEQILEHFGLRQYIDVVSGIPLDPIGAKMARIDFIGVLYGYGSREELEAERTDAIADSVAALRSLLLS